MSSPTNGSIRPSTEEFTLSSGATLGTRGYFQATYVRRRSSSFVEDYQDLTTGTTTITDPDTGEDYGTFTNQVFANPGDLGDDADVLQRNYDGLQFEARYQLFDSLLLNGSTTIQLNSEGNFDGENTNQPGVSSVYGDWPEVTPADRFHPWGRLDDYQKHRVRVWGIYTLGMGFMGDLDVGGFWRYDSAENYSLASSSLPGDGPSSRPSSIELGYVDGPTTRTLYYDSGSRVGALQRRESVRPVAPLRHPGLAGPAAVAEVRLVQRDQQRQAGLLQHDRSARLERPDGRVGDPDHVHRREQRLAKRPQPATTRRHGRS